MLQCNKSRLSAPPTQLTQLVVNGVTRARARTRKVQTTQCVSCVSSQDSCGFAADGLVADPVPALDSGQGSGWAALTPAAEGQAGVEPLPQAGLQSTAATTVRKAGHVPATPPLRLQHSAILALDLGQKTGWAVRTADGLITSGTAEFKPGRHEGGGMGYLRFRRWLDELRLTTGGLAEVLYEEVRAHRGTLAAQIYGAFVGHLQAWCEGRAIAYAGVPVGTIKRHITGRGNADKEAVIAAVRALGFTPADDNEADALALLDWALRNGGRR
jgi:hypothetical protein